MNPKNYKHLGTMPNCASCCFGRKGNAESHRVGLGCATAAKHHIAADQKDAKHQMLQSTVHALITTEPMAAHILARQAAT